MTYDAGPASGLWAVADLVTPMAIRVAATLRIADHIARGLSTGPELAEAAGADADTLERLLRHLVTADVLSRDEAGGYALTTLGAELRDDHPGGTRDLLDLESALGRAESSLIHLLHSIRTGDAAFPLLFGRSFWDDLSADPARTASFDAQMGADVAEWAKAVVPALIGLATAASAMFCGRCVEATSWAAVCPSPACARTSRNVRHPTGAAHCPRRRLFGPSADGPFGPVPGPGVPTALCRYRWLRRPPSPAGVRPSRPEPLDPVLEQGGGDRRSRAEPRPPKVTRPDRRHTRTRSVTVTIPSVTRSTRRVTPCPGSLQGAVGSPSCRRRDHWEDHGLRRAAAVLVAGGSLAAAGSGSAASRAGTPDA